MAKYGSLLYLVFSKYLTLYFTECKLTEIQSNFSEFSVIRDLQKINITHQNHLIKNGVLNQVVSIEF